MKVLPYTRKSKKKSKSYIKTVPSQNIVKFHMGDSKAFAKGKFPYILKLIIQERVQIRSNALEASRQFINKKLEKSFSGQYFFKVIPYPHHIQRENKMLTGAGSDRMQTGMQLSFGKTIARASIIKPGDEIFLIAIQSKKAEAFTRHLLHQIKAKIPGKKTIVSENLKK